MVHVAWMHPSNRGLRIRAVVRCVYHYVVTRGLGRASTTRLGDSMRIYVNPARPASSRPVYANPPDPEEMAVWNRVIRPGDRFIDVGANIGIYTLLLADLGARVSALEPGDVDELHRNLELNGLPVPVIRSAASDQTGSARFTTLADQENAMVVDSTSGTEQTVEVTTVRVDDVIGQDHVRGVKVDVEGFERLVLQGMATTLSEHRVDVVQLEWNRKSEHALGEDRSPVADLLRTWGYTLAHPHVEGTLTPCGAEYDVDDSIDRFALSPSIAPFLLQRP